MVYTGFRIDAIEIQAIPLIGGILMATKQVAFRLDEDLLDRVDAYADRMTRETPGVQFSRVDAVRFLLTHALDELDKGSARKRRDTTPS